MHSSSLVLHRVHSVLQHQYKFPGSLWDWQTVIQREEETQQLQTVTARHWSETTLSYLWCYVAMEFGSQPLTLCHPRFTLCFLPLFPQLCRSPVLFVLLLLSVSLSFPSFLFFQSFSLCWSGPPVFLSSHALFLKPGYIVVLHAFSICLHAPCLQPLLSHYKNTSVNILCTWIGAIKCLFALLVWVMIRNSAIE